MFNLGFYLKLINGEYGSSLTAGSIPTNHPRLLKNLEEYLESNTLPKGAKLNHYRPARYFAENVGSLESALTEPQLDRFREAFKELNSLLE